MIVTKTVERGAARIQWREDGDTLKPPTARRTDPTIKKLLDLDVSITTAE